MKKKFFIVALLFCFAFSFAQAPQGINYQAAARDNAGNILANQAVSFRLAILQGSISGSVVYQETHNLTTNAVGLVNFIIGTGTVNTGTFSAINWASGSYFLQVEMAVGAGSFQQMGTSQFVSVPYALYAERSGDKAKPGKGITISNDSINSSWSYYGNDVVANNSGNVGIGAAPNFQKLEVNGGVGIGNTSTSSPGAMRFTGADFEGYTGATWKSFTKSSLDGFEYTNPNSNNISSTSRNTLVILNTDSIVVPATGTYLIIYTGRGYNGGSYDVALPATDYECTSGVVNVTQSSLAYVNGAYSIFGSRYLTSTAVTSYYQFSSLTFNVTTFAHLNGGDVLKPGAVVSGSTPAPTGVWQVLPFRIQLIKLN